VGGAKRDLLLGGGEDGGKTEISGNFRGGKVASVLFLKKRDEYKRPNLVDL